MQYPNTQLFIRRVFINRASGRAIACFRANPLNARAVWYAPVPLYEHALIFDNYLAPLRHYEPALLATEHIHAEVDTNNITLDLLDHRIVQDIEHLQGQLGAARSGAGGVARQKALQDWRDKMIVELFNNEMHRIDDAPGDFKVRNGILKEICTRTCMSAGTVEAALVKAGMDFTRITGVRHEPSKFVTGYPHRKQNEMLQAAMRGFRSAQYSGTVDGSFGVNDLLTSDPGGYPLLCPVTGLDLDWTFEGSFYSPKVSKRAASAPVSGENICIMSMIGKRIVMGTGSPQTIGKWFTQVRGVEPFYVPKIMKSISEWRQAHPDPVIDKMFLGLLTLGYNLDVPDFAIRKPTPAPTEQPQVTYWKEEQKREQVTPQLKDKPDVRAILGGWGDTE